MGKLRIVDPLNHAFYSRDFTLFHKKNLLQKKQIRFILTPNYFGNPFFKAKLARSIAFRSFQSIYFFLNFFFIKLSKFR